MKHTLAVFGSAFNPPSLGHRSVLERLTHFDEVLLLPSFNHAWGKEMLDYSLRCELVSAFIDDIGQDNLVLSTLEQDIAVGDQAVTTYAVLAELQKRYPSYQITFVVGPDNFLNFNKFFMSKEILSQWQVLACPETLSVRSTQIRDALTENKNISDLTTVSVCQLLMADKRFHF
ncbi:MULTISPECIES: nicotinate-nicotinamide nucleotide adenylyltransferase [unclassified Photobacterium]|uniref:nicotinate-nicotinamide nucleotide adenylyltransferase n=1 Tax=unclassified Photobacterium TaxID=2628852 RepID=UPI001EDFCFBC|nr:MULTISPECIES: nicotinate-nicotinamide nucleotide adenylyltransferase [unclassified Photobacterium]MCG3864551.1 nicotinate-nicotinamide nucleotide adenylyltransferase [Photobacterium sp. Ph6]MCG3876041.1 nicotinate-nicotinamide nucleotide adenylyltransferase [Photobacterium sp. Ph5]